MSETSQIMTLENDPESTGWGLIKLILISIFFSIFLITDVYVINNRVDLNNHTHFVYGIRKGTSAYSRQFKFDTSGLESLSEGYLLKEDFIHYIVSSNLFQSDTNKATDTFYQLLHGNTAISMSELKSYQIYMINVYTVYSGTASNPNLEPVYLVRVYDRNGNIIFTSNSTSLVEVKNYVQSSLIIKIDIAGGILESIHKAQKYDKRGETGDGQQTYSTYNTFMCVGKDIPIRGMFGSKKYNFSEIQTYSTLRQEGN